LIARQDQYNNQIKEKPEELSIFLFFQEDRFKMHAERYKVTLDLSELKAKCASEKEFVKKAAVIYFEWSDAIKTAMRPQWVDPDMTNCFICEREFTFTGRQHHCRKCGTAVCDECSPFRTPLPELAYYDEVRVCKNCFENITIQQTFEEKRRISKQKNIESLRTRKNSAKNLPSANPPSSSVASSASVRKSAILYNFDKYKEAKKTNRSNSVSTQKIHGSLRSVLENRGA
jgi:hypothetical protein